MGMAMSFDKSVPDPDSREGLRMRLHEAEMKVLKLKDDFQKRERDLLRANVALEDKMRQAVQMSKAAEAIKDITLNGFVDGLASKENRLKKRFVGDLKKCLLIYSEHGAIVLAQSLIDLAKKMQSEITPTQENPNGKTQA